VVFTNLDNIFSRVKNFGYDNRQSRLEEMVFRKGELFG